MFYLDVAYMCNDFQVFSGVFASISDACFKCFRCFGGMLQVFRMNVAKVDRVAYVAMVVHVCCNLLFPMFHLFFKCTFVGSR